MKSGNETKGGWRAAFVAACIAACVVALTACGSESDSDNGGDGSGGGTADVAEAEARLAKSMAVPEFVAGTKLDPEKLAELKGETIWFISQSQAVPYFVAVYEGIQEAAEAAGMKTRVFDAQGKPTAFNQGVSAAIAQGAAGIVLGFPPDQMQSALGEKAEAAGIPITDVGVADLDDPLEEGAVGHVGWSYSDSGRRQADWVIADSGGNARVLVILSSGYKVQDYRVDGFSKEFEELCPDCSIADVHHIPFAEWTSQIPSLITSELTQDPEIKYILVSSDAQTLHVVRGLRQIANKDIKVVTSDSTEDGLERIRTGEYEAADIGVSENWLGWAAVDVLLRAITTGKSGDGAVPLRMFTEENVPAPDEPGFPVDWATGYKEQWGLG